MNASDKAPSTLNSVEWTWRQYFPKYIVCPCRIRRIVNERSNRRMHEILCTFSLFVHRPCCTLTCNIYWSMYMKMQINLIKYEKYVQLWSIYDRTHTHTLECSAARCGAVETKEIQSVGCSCGGNGTTILRLPHLQFYANPKVNIFNLIVYKLATRSRQRHMAYWFLWPHIESNEAMHIRCVNSDK